MDKTHDPGIDGEDWGWLCIANFHMCTAVSRIAIQTTLGLYRFWLQLGLVICEKNCVYELCGVISRKGKAEVSQSLRRLAGRNPLSGRFGLVCPC